MQNNNWIKDISFRNTNFLKNSQVFHEISKNVYWDVKPILIYYSSSYLFSFFINSFIDFNPSRGHHGLSVDCQDNNIENIKVEIMKFGLFPRIVKSLSFIFFDSLFSDYIIDFTGFPSDPNSKVELYSNSNKFSIEENKDILLKDLIAINIKDIKTNFRNIKLKYTFDNRWERYRTTSFLLRDYIYIFTAGFLARYKPGIWREIYEGNSSEMFIHFKKAFGSVGNTITLISDEIGRWEGHQTFQFFGTLSGFL